ncbi:hypothetical protein SEVIR_4G067903v4 [Setaria viridis]
MIVSTKAKRAQGAAARYPEQRRWAPPDWPARWTKGIFLWVTDSCDTRVRDGDARAAGRVQGPRPGALSFCACFSTCCVRVGLDRMDHMNISIRRRVRPMAPDKASGYSVDRSSYLKQYRTGGKKEKAMAPCIERNMKRTLFREREYEIVRLLGRIGVCI